MKRNGFAICVAAALSAGLFRVAASTAEDYFNDVTLYEAKTPVLSAAPLPVLERVWYAEQNSAGLNE